MVAGTAVEPMLVVGHTTSAGPHVEPMLVGHTTSAGPQG